MTHEVDKHVGQRIRKMRWLKDVTQQQLADQVGCKFQQIQKYETGANRVSASRLWDIAAALGVPVATFFEGLDGSDATALPISRHDAEFDRAMNSLTDLQRTCVTKMVLSFKGGAA